MKNNIVFLNPDDPRSAEALANAVRSGIGNAVSIGLIVKVDQYDQIVNWMMADTETIKFMAATLPPSPHLGENQ